MKIIIWGLRAVVLELNTFIKEREYMELGLYFVVVISILGILIYGLYETKKKYKLKVQKIILEREKIALEHKKLE